MKLYWKYERLLKGYGGSSGSEARGCEHPQDKEAPGKKGFQIFLPRGMLKGRSTWASSQTHSGDVQRFVQSPSTSRTSRLSRENRPRSLWHLPMTLQAVREKSKELNGKMPLLWEHLDFVSSTYLPWLLWFLWFLIQVFSPPGHCPGTVLPKTQLKLWMELPGHQIQMRKGKKGLN